MLYILPFGKQGTEKSFQLIIRVEDKDGNWVDDNFTIKYFGVIPKIMARFRFEDVTTTRTIENYYNFLDKIKKLWSSQTVLISEVFRGSLKTITNFY